MVSWFLCRSSCSFEDSASASFICVFAESSWLMRIIARESIIRMQSLRLPKGSKKDSPVLAESLVIRVCIICLESLISFLRTCEFSLSFVFCS